MNEVLTYDALLDLPRIVKSNAEANDGYSMEIDKDGFSGRYKGISQEYSNVENNPLDNSITTNSNGTTFRLLINNTNESVPVYEGKARLNPSGGATTPNVKLDGDIIGYINPHDFYLRYALADQTYDNIHRVMFHDGTDVKMGYIQEHPFFGMFDDDTSDKAVENQILPGHEPFTCCNYNAATGNYIFHNWNEEHEFTINQPVPYFSQNGNYQGMLNKGDKIKINSNNVFRTGASRPWCAFVDEIVKTNGEKENNCFVSCGIEYGNGSNRAWY